MGRSGVRSVRLPCTGSGIAAEASGLEPDFDAFDQQVGSPPKHGIRVMPFLWGTPEWVAEEQIACR